MMNKPKQAHWLMPGYFRAGAVALPVLCLLLCRFQLSGGLHIFEQAVGGFALLVVPGYTLLWVLGLDPLAVDTSGYRWALVVPLSVAIDVLLGTFMVLTPIGLSSCSLWAGVSILVLICVLGNRLL